MRLKQLIISIAVLLACVPVLFAGQVVHFRGMHALKTVDEFHKWMENNKVTMESFDSEKNTLLHCAVTANSMPIVKELLAGGIDINSKNKWGSTPLHLVALFGNDEMVRLIMEAGAKPNLRNGHRGRTYYDEIDCSRESLDQDNDM